MGCGPSRATEASAYGVDAAGCVPDAPSTGRQTPACSRGEDACPHPEEPHPEGTQSDAPSAKRHRSVCAPRDDDERLLSGVDGRCPPEVSSTSTLRWRGSLAATHPLASAASPGGWNDGGRNLARWTEPLDENDPYFTDLAFSRSASSVATSASATSECTDALSSTFRRALTETEKTDDTSGNDELTTSDKGDEKDDEDETTAYREVLAAAAAAVREAVDAVRVAAAPRADVFVSKQKPTYEHTVRVPRCLSALMSERHDALMCAREEDVRVPPRVPSISSIPLHDDDDAMSCHETKPAKVDILENDAGDKDGYRFLPGVGVTTSRRAPAAAVAKTAMDLARKEKLVRGRVIRF